MVDTEIDSSVEASWIAHDRGKCAYFELTGRCADLRQEEQDGIDTDALAEFKRTSLCRLGDATTLRVVVAFVTITWLGKLLLVRSS